MGDVPIGNGLEGTTVTPKAMNDLGENGYRAEFVCFNDGKKFFVTTTGTAGALNTFNDDRLVADVTGSGDYTLANNNTGFITLGAGRYTITVKAGQMNVVKTSLSDFDNLLNYTPKLINNNEQSIFLKTKAQATPYVFASDANDGILNVWPGQKMSLLGKEGDYYIFKWVSPYTTSIQHASLVINDGKVQEAATQNNIGGYANFNHHIYELGEDENYNNISDGGTITELAQRTPAPQNAVIYEMSLVNNGNLAGAANKIDELAKKGVTIISLMPIYEAGASGNPYAMRDQFNRTYGSQQDLQVLIDAAHSKGIKVLLDIVLDRTSTDSRWVTAYPDCYLKQGGNFVHPEINGVEATDQYKLDLNNSGTQWAIVDALKNTLKQLGSADDNYKGSFDGFRIDNADGIPAPGFSRVLNVMYALNPNLIILGDIDLENTSAENYRQVGLDYDYAKNMQANVLTAIGNGDGADKLSNVATLAEALKWSGTDFTTIVPRTLYTTNHALNKEKSQAELYGDNETAFTALTYTLPGIPMIYNGQETGYLTNHKVNYYTNSTEQIGTGTNGALPVVIETLGKLRKESKVLNSTATIKVHETTGNGILAFTREAEGEQVLVLFNLSGDEQNITVSDVEQAKWTRVLSGNNTAADKSEVDVTFDNNTTVTLAGHGYAVYQLKDSYKEEDKGWYVHPQNDPTGMNYKMTKKDDNTYEIIFTANKFYEMSQNNAKLVFDLKELKTENEKIGWSANNLTPGADLTEVTDAGVAGNDNTSGNKFQITSKPDAKQYTLTLTKNGGAYTLKLEYTTVLKAGVYLMCQGNEEGAQVEDFQFTELPQPDEDGYTHHLLITQEDFTYFSGNTANPRLFFKLQPYSVKDGVAVIDNLLVTTKEGEPNGYIFKDDKDDSVYDECGFTNNGTNFFVLDKITGYASYDIRYKDARTSEGAFDLKVVYNRDYTWNGAEVGEGVLTPFNGNASGLDFEKGKDVYLYNVETGKFLWNRGGWGTQAMAPYSEFGLKMRIAETTDLEAYYNHYSKKYGTSEKPSYTFYTYSDQGDNATQGSFLGYDQNKYNENGGGRLQNAFWIDRGGKLGDGRSNQVRDQSGSFRWHLYPIESGADAKTYLLSIEMYVDGNGDYNRAPQEFFVNVDDNSGTTDYALQRNNVKLNDLRDDAGQPLELAKARNYRWQLVTEDELRKAFVSENAEAFGGMLTDATFLFDNPDFARGLEKTITRDEQTRTSWKNEAGNYTHPVGDNEKDGEFYYADLNGSGKLTQTKKMPVSGVYSITLNGFAVENDNAKVTVAVKGSETYELPLPRISNDEFNNVQNKYADEATDKGKKAGYSIGKTLYVDDQSNYRNMLYFYIPEMKDGVDGTVTVTIESNGRTIVDNFRATYLGEAPFVLNPAAKNTSYFEKEKREKVPVFINRRFYPGAWQAIFLPFNVSKAQLKQAFGSKVKLSKANGLSEDDYYNIEFKKVDMSGDGVAIEANEFYIVKPALVRSVDQTVERDGTKLTPMTDKENGYVSLGFHNMSGTAPAASVTKTFDGYTGHNNLVFTGLNAHSTVQIPAKSYTYVFYTNKNTRETQLRRLEDTSIELDGFRFYIRDVDPSTGSKEIRYIVDDDEELIDDEDGTLTPVDRVVEEDASNVKREGIYTISGQRVSGDVKDLPNGLYIINGEKVFIKK